MSKITITSEDEKETEIICFIGNREGLFKASKIYHQEQAQVRGSGKARGRVRRERSKNAKQWVHTQTVKVKKESNDSTSVVNGEYTQTINRQTFGMFLILAGEMQRKTRFHFPIGQLKLTTEGRTITVELKRAMFEVDVFYKEDGTVSDWCKIDVEHKPIIEELEELGFKDKTYDFILPVASLPFAPSKAFIVGAPENPPASIKLRNFLYEVEWARSVDVDKVIAEFLSGNNPEEEPEKLLQEP